MLVTYQRVGKLSVLPALALVAAAVVFAGVAALTLVFVGLAAAGVVLLRTFLRATGRVSPRAAAPDPDVIEGVVVDKR